MSRRGAHLGQHFLNNPHYAELLANSVGATRETAILEIGPGTGALTRELLKTGAHVVAVEKDNSLAETLRTTFAAEIADGRFELVVGDVRNFNPSTHPTLVSRPYILAANIPYYITGEIIRQFLETTHQPTTIALLIQREVAQRIISATESILSISVKAYGTPKILAKVTKGNFTPPPSVDSAILSITGISKNNFVDIAQEAFFDVVRAGFAAKRKLLVNNLGVKYGKDTAAQALTSAAVSAAARAETIGVQDWFKIARILVGTDR